MSKVEQIQRFYAKRQECHEEYSRLGWASETSQFKRFDVLIQNVNLQSKYILDVGCGAGTLYKYLLSRRIETEYVGTDILPFMIDKCKSKYLDGNFLCADIFHDDLLSNIGTFDVVYASGIFNINLSNNFEFLRLALEKFFRLSSKYIVFNLLSDKPYNKDNTYFYFNQDEVCKLVNDMFGNSLNIEIFNEYLGDNDFTVKLTKVNII